MTRLLSCFWLLAAIVLATGISGCTAGGDSGDMSADDESSDTAGDATGGDDQVAVIDAPSEIKAGWGHFKCRFTIAGAPQAEALTITKDEAYCGKFMLHDESLVVGPGGGLANVVVVLNVKRGDPLPEMHESYKASETANVVLDNLECRFIPRVVLLRTTQTLEVRNSDPDPIAHNTKIEADPPINDTIAPGGTFTRQFRAQPRPAPVSCSIHPWMTAKLIVKESPYMAVTDANGDFVIENLPSGEWEFQFWQERLGYVRMVNLAGKDVEWERGIVSVPISGGETTDWGEVKIDFAKYKE